MTSCPLQTVEVAMESVSERLQRARTDAGLTLEQISEQTKIQRWILAAIERDDFSRLPGGVFIRGYLTSFAGAVGLDGERVWADYRAETSETRVPAVEPDREDLPESPRGGASPWRIAVIAAAVLVAAVVWRNIPRGNPDTLPVPAPEPQERASEVVPAAAPTAGGEAETVAAVDSTHTARVAPASPPLIVTLHASADVWVEAKVDGQQRVYRLVTAGEELRLDARNEIVLRVGDASAVTYTINGAAGRPLGGPGAVREIVISPETYPSLVSADAAHSF